MNKLQELILGLEKMMEKIYGEKMSETEYDNKVILEGNKSSIVVTNDGDLHLISDKYGYKKYMSFKSLTKYLNDIYFA